MRFAVILAGLLSILAPGPAPAASVFTSRPDDPAAVTLAAPDFAVRGDGVADDSAAIQAAIDKAASKPGGGLLFVPSGRYRLTRTLYVWRAVRLIGVGETRPVFVLAENTPGYQHGIGRRRRPGQTRVREHHQSSSTTRPAKRSAASTCQSDRFRSCSGVPIDERCSSSPTTTSRR